MRGVPRPPCYRDDAGGRGLPHHSQCLIRQLSRRTIRASLRRAIVVVEQPTEPLASTNAAEISYLLSGELTDSSVNAVRILNGLHHEYRLVRKAA
jgi:hypothetical protein